MKLMSMTSRRNLSAKNQTRRPMLEQLEDRLLMAVSVGPNVNVSNAPGNQAEVTIALNTTNPLNLIASSNDLGFTTNDPTWFSMDGGLNWTLSPIPNVAGGGAGGDPALAFDRVGNAYYAHLSGAGIAVAKSTDGGQNWTAVAIPTPAGGVDKEFFGVGPDVNNLAQDRIYIGYHVGNVMFVNSSMDGVTWTAPVQVSDVGNSPGINSQIAVDEAGVVYYVWQEINAPGIVELSIDKSFDGGVTWGTDSIITTSNVSRFNDPFTVRACTRYCVPSAPVRGIGEMMSIDVDLTGGPFNGRLYEIVIDQGDLDGDPDATNAVDHDDTDIFLVYSDDQGATWSPKIRVNDDVGTASQFNAWLDVDQITGAVGIAWYDARDDANNEKIASYFTVSVDGGNTFEPNVRVSEGFSDQSNSNPQKSFFDYGEYKGLAFHNGMAHVLWADNSGLLGTSPGDQDVFSAAVTTNVFPFVVTSNPVDGAVVLGTIANIDFTFNVPMDPTSFNFVDNPVTPEDEDDVIIFTGPGGNDLKPDITGFSWLAGNTLLRLNFLTQGAPGDYSITIGPNITDPNANPMDQDQDQTPGEPIQDQFTMGFSIPTPKVTSVRVLPNQVLVTFNKPLDQPSLTGNVFVDRSGGDQIFGDPIDGIGDDVVVANSTAAVYNAATITLTFTLPFNLVDDLYRVRLEDSVTDAFGNPLDGEFDGPASPTGCGGNGNQFPSGNDVVGCDFLYPFFLGSTGVPVTALPALVRTDDPVDVSNLGGQRNESQPTIAVDPLDPQKLVATYQIIEPTANTCNQSNSFRRNDISRCVAYSFSTNGGATWSFGSVLPIPRNPTTVTTTDPGFGFAGAITPSVAFDRNHNFYVVYSVVTPVANPDDNAILLRRFNFNGATPVAVINADHIRCPTALYCGAGSAQDDVARNPVIVVDTNPSGFTDPATGIVFNDPYTAGGQIPVYVAWDIVRQPRPNVAGGFNPNGVQLAASADGGVGFSAPFNVNGTGFGDTSGFFGTDRNILPQIAVAGALPELSPGVPDPDSGRVHVVWEEFGLDANFDFLQYDRMTNDVTDNGSRGLGTLERATSFAGIFESSTTVDRITVSEDFTISDLNLDIRLNHPDLRDVLIQLRSPSGTVALVSALGGGTAFPNMGSSESSSDVIGTKIDDEAATSLQQGNAPWQFGEYQPSGSLAVFDGEDSAGTWTLQITDLSGAPNATPVGRLFMWGLQISGDIGQDAFDFDQFVTSTRLKANNPLQAPAASVAGISMAPVIATDKTLGSFSPNQGAIYVAYTERLNPTDRPNDTDVFFLTSTDGGANFQFGNVDPLGFIRPVHDDHTNEVSTGQRTQFQPSIAVDNTTGTVVVSWLDARNDAANARVATYISASVDGGQTFSANEFVNRPQLENDNLDPRNPCTACINMGPIPDNQSTGNPIRDANAGFGTHQGLAVAAGHVYAAWASNENQRDDTSGDRRLDIRVSQAAIAAGPRVIDSSMGPVSGSASSYTVQFDRPVDPSSITLGSDVTNSVFLANFETGNNGFTFNNRGPDGFLGTVDDGLWHRSTGRGNDSGHSLTQSMYYGRNEGPTGGGDYNTNPGQLTAGNSGFLTSPVITLPTGILTLSFNYFLDTENSFFFDAAVVEISTNGGLTFAPLADKATGLNNPTAGFENFQTDLSVFGGRNVILRFSFDTVDGILNFFEGWYVDDVSITATTPSDVALVARDEFGNALVTQPAIQSITPRSCNQFGCSSFTINFAQSIQEGTFSYTVGPMIQDRIRMAGATGALLSSGNAMDQDADDASTGRLPGDRYFAPRSASDTSSMPIIVAGPHVVSSSAGVEYPQAEFPTPVTIPDGGTITSSFTITDRYPILDLDVLLNISHSFDQDLTVSLSHTDRLGCTTTVPLFSGVGASGDDFVRTILDDTGAGGSITTGTAPFTGSFRPQAPNLLSAFETTRSAPTAVPGCAVTSATGGNIEGIWTLSITDAAGNGGGMLNSWSLIVNPDPASDPLAENLVLNGTVSFFDVRFDQPMNPNTFKTEDVQRLIGPAGLIGPRPQDSFATGPIRTSIPDGTNSLVWPLNISRSAIIHDLNVQFDITHPNVVDLTVRLTSPDPDGAGPLLPITVTLVNGVGGVGDNFIRTILDDEQPIAINAGAAPAVAPFAGRYRPQQALSAFDGRNIQGTWTLEVLDGTPGNVGRLENWSLSLDPLTITPNPRGTDANPSFPTTYRISFPKQTLSGTYQLTVGPNITSQRGKLMDQDLDAGLKASRGVDPAPKTFTTTLSTPRPTITNDSIPLLSSISIDDNFIVRDVDVQLDITHLNVSDIRAFLAFNDPNGTQTRVELFTGVGGTGNNFSGTILDDEGVFVNNTPRVIGAANTSAPFLGRFRPEQFNSALPGTRLSDFDGKNARGTWTLEVTDSVTNGFVGTLNNWSLTFQAVSQNEPQLDFDQTGLGNLAADKFGGSFRIFVMDQTDVRATSVWTAVGPAAIGVNGNSGRTGAIAVDFSDPSGNTVFVAGATGGVWKTNNFLTPDADGPTWIPLTDFGPTFSLSMGSLALFPRNQDPNQTIVYAATGEGDAGFGGTGFLKSMDGGATWQILDSTDNRAPFAQRTHNFDGSLAFKIIVDYTSPDVVYAALSASGAGDPTNPADAGGGIWRSFDGGLTWTRARAGSATDLAIDPVNPEVLYAAFEGEGVFRTPDKGFRWDLLTGGVGNPQFVDGDLANFPSIPVNAPTDNTGAVVSPNGFKGRISLGKPPTNDPKYQGWIYALVARTDGSLDGVYQSKDFGQNWVKLNLAGLAADPAVPGFRPFPTNDESQLNVDPLCVAGLQCQGNYDQSIAVDAVNPNVVYIGGMDDPAMIRIDTTRTYDAHAIIAFDSDNADGGRPEPDATVSGVSPGGGVIRKSTASNGPNSPPAPDIADPSATTSLACEFTGVPIRRGYNVFDGCQSNVASIANTGQETQWQEVTLFEHADHHDMFTYVDPITGKGRIIVGTDGGFWTGVDDELQDPDGALNTVSRIGTAVAGSGDRNGNLQITQFYYGAVQPNQLSADVSGTLFFGASQDNGLAISGPNVLIDGQIGTYGSIGGDVGGVATDPTGSGIYYAYFWPCCSFSPLRQEFFLVSDTNLSQPGFQGGPRVNGLFQFGGIGTEWPLLGPTYGANFAVNPRDGQQLAISSNTGRVYKQDRASDPFTAWFQIGDPAIFGNSQSFALAYGAAAPDSDPNDTQQPDDILYVGTSIGPNAGSIFVTFTEGGSNAADWFDISVGLDGSSVRQIVANLKEGSKEAFAVTFTGVFHLPDSEAAVNDVISNGSNANAPWEDITGNLFQIVNTLYPGWNADNPNAVDTIPKLLRTIQVDDRYQIPNSPGVNCAVDVANCHPLIYVAGDAGVYRSFDLGQTWDQYPSITVDNATLQGGYLPNVIVSDLDLATGPFDPVTGLTDFTQSLDILSAATFGRGTFAIRTSPLIFSVGGSGVSNAPDLLAADDTGVSNSDNITSHDGSAQNPLRFTGLTMRGASVEIFEEDANGALRLVGADLADPVTGNWEVAINPVVPLQCGPHKIRAQATTFVGTKGPLSLPIVISVLNERPKVTVGPDLVDADDTLGVGTAGTNTDNLTRITTPRFTGTTVCGTSLQPVGSATMRLMVPNSLPIPNVKGPVVVDPDTLISYATVGTGTTLADGTWTAQVATGTPLVPDGTYPIVVRAEDLAGNIGMVAGPINVTIDTVVNPSPIISAIVDDTCDPLGSSAPTPCNFGSRTDRITNDRTLIISGTVEANSLVTLRQSSGPAIPGGPVLGSVLANGAGNWMVDLSSITLADGSYSFTVSAVDRAGNTSPTSAASSVTIDTSTPTPTMPDLIDTDDTCAPPNSVFPTACTRGSHTDNITRVTRPTMTGRAEVGTRVDLFTNVAGFTFLGSAIAGSDASDGVPNDGLGLWTFTVATSPGAVTGPLNSGQSISVLYNVTTVATDVAGNVSGASNALALTIDTEPPLKPSIPPDLDSNSDTFPAPPPSIGTDTDNITRDTTPTLNGLNGSAEPDGLVTLFSKDRSTNNTATLGTAGVNSLGGWTFTVATGSGALTGPLADGQYDITFDNTDIAGNSSLPSDPLTPPLVIDTVVAAPSAPDLTDASDTCDPPSSVVPAPCDRGTHADNITRTNTPSFTGTAEALGRVELFAGAQSLGVAAVVGNDASDGNPTDGKGAWTFTTNWSSLLPIDGTYTITARATDRAANTSASSSGLNVTIDRSKPTAPTTPDLIPASDTGISNSDNITRGNSPAFNGAVTINGTADLNTTVRIFDNATCTGPALGQTTPASNRIWTFTTVPLSDGVHSITSTATDSAGNESDCSGVLSIVIDTGILQPGMPVLDPASDSGIAPNGSNSDKITSDNTPSLSGAVEANTTGIPQANTSVTVFDGTNAIATFPANSSGTWNLTPTTALSDGNHVLTVRATDAAGNSSIASPALNITVDTAIGIPVISRITPDNGPSSTDHVTNDGSLMFRGTAEPCTAVLAPSPLGCTQVTLTQVGVAGTFGTAYTDSLGNWTFDNSAMLLPPGNYSFTATARDAAGNVSFATLPFNVTIDTAPPAFNAAPSLELLSDTGIFSDLITKLRQPRLAGNVLDNLANVQVQIFREADVLANNFSDPLGTATASANGAYVVQVDAIHALANGSYTVRILATDAAGNAAISPSLTFTVDATPPNVESFCSPTATQACPTSPVTATTGQLVVGFNSADLNVCPSPGGSVALCGTNPSNAFAASVLNPANFSLVGTSRGAFNLATSQFVLGPGATAGTSVLTINLRDASNNPAPLPNDTWRFTIDGTSSVQDIAGNKLDGEFPGTGTANCQPQSRPTGFPTGNCVEGGNFVRTFTVNVPPPRVVVPVTTEGTRKVISNVFITFTGAMNRALATNGNNYELRDPGKDKLFDTVDDKVIVLAQPTCNPEPADCTRVTLTAIRGFSRKRPVRLTVRDSLQDVGGNRLDGNGDGVPGGNFSTIIGPTVAARTAQVAAQVVDRMLESGDTPTDLIVDGLLNSAARRGRWLS